MSHMMLRVIVFLNLILFLNPVFSKEIPVIVISPGKTIQSKSIVGSDITVVNDQQISDSDFFIGDVIILICLNTSYVLSIDRKIYHLLNYQ